MAEMKMNSLPVRTWNWLGMNKSMLEGEDAELMNRVEQKTPVKAYSAQKEEKDSIFCFMCEAEENRTQEADLIAGEESRLTVWMEVSSPKDARGLFALATRIKAGRNAMVRLVQVQLLGAGCRFVNEIKAECEEGARVELLQLFLGSEKTWSGFLGNLEGVKSGISVQSGYWCRKKQWLDMNYVVLHKAKNTESHISTKGVLEDNAFKLFRGTIDFKQGASGSEGEETEEVLMLGENAASKTIPLILCGEEDVRGNHGATIGEPDEEVLFYMASRGIGKDEATALLARAKIEGLRAQIGNRKLEERVKAYLEEVTENE